MAWRTTRGTFTRLKFHRAFVSSVLRHLNHWPFPKSIVVLDNARIHMYSELEAAIHSCSAVLLFLPPYCPLFNPIVVLFGQLKRWQARHANLAFGLYPEKVLEVAMRACTRQEPSGGTTLFRHCGYGNGGLEESVFDRDLERFH
ncbi:Transposase [Phytophthora megakarya]|uniref:Transposase n=1 Tax=Phytophthora megakarya TaxID=4795 RepID=A0A225WK76_9STRA|nr:Transposase [Phytophthora megakarya]